MSAQPAAQAPKAGGLRAGARRLYKRLRGGALTPSRAALSVGIGVFIGCLPLYGLHLPLCALVCLPLRLDLVTCYLAANISNPFFAPFLLVVEVEVGSRLLHGRAVDVDRSLPLAELASRFISELALGAPLVGGALALLLGAIAFAAVNRGRAKDGRLAAAIVRTSARYASAPRKHRFYVRGKLRFDPLTAHIATWGKLGEVTDLGCGRGQFALLLLELGAAERVTGYDFDAEKIQVARAAAKDLAGADFQQADLTSPPAFEADTVLLLDVLHYLPTEAQARLLEHVAKALHPNARLFIREASASARPSSALTRFAERIGKRLQVNRADEFRFVEPADLQEALQRLGLESELSDGSDGTPLDNYLLVCRQRPAEPEAAPSESAAVHEVGQGSPKLRV